MLLTAAARNHELGGRSDIAMSTNYNYYFIKHRQTKVGCNPAECRCLAHTDTHYHCSSITDCPLAYMPHQPEVVKRLELQDCAFMNRWVWHVRSGKINGLITLRN